MQRIFTGFLSVVALLFLLLNGGCTKIDSTTLGTDLIPAVDNVNTFESILPIDGTQGLFDDSTRLSRNEYHLLGSITNDPQFGQTKADIFLELKPSFFPFTFGNKNDTINNILAPGSGFDSVVLCLSVNGFYGDTTKGQHISVYQINKSNADNFRYDSTYSIHYQHDVMPDLLVGKATIYPTNLKDTLLLDTTSKEKVAFQIRINLKENNNSFLKELIANLDTSASGSGNNIYRSDSIFKSLIKGLAVVSDVNPIDKSNGLFYTSLTDGKTRLEVYFRRKNNNKKVETSFSSFYFSTGLGSSSIFPSAHANTITRDRETGSPAPEYPNRMQADALYIQSVPGTFATLKIPGLDTFKNSIIHRAEIIAEQIPGDPVFDNIFSTPQFLYLDLKDTGAVNRYKTIYTDLNPSSVYFPDNSLYFYPSAGIDFNYFGGFHRSKKDVFGNNISYYNFNVSRYVQNIVTKKGVNYPMRLYAPYNLDYYNKVFAFPNSTQALANGRVKIGNGNNPNYRLRLRIIYSKI